MTRRQAMLLSLALCALLSGARLLPYNFVRAQSVAANLSGIVVDEKGAVIPDVEITMVNNGTALQREATSNSDGYWIIPLLPPGVYTLTAKRQGFATLTSRDVVLNVNDQRAIRIQLRVGRVDETVIVNAESGVQESPAVGTVIDRQFVGNLPLNGRSFQSLILLTPGVVPAASLSGDVGQFSVNGQRSNANYFTVDGVSANTGVTFSAGGGFVEGLSQQLSGALPSLSALGTTQSLVSIDALEEFKIQTSTYSAEYGRQPGGQVQLVTRSGANQFHATFVEYLRNEIFDANNWFTNRAGQSRAPLRQNQFGGTFSGPVRLPGLYNGRNRTFFFFSYEGLRLRLPVSPNLFVPSARLRQTAAPGLRPILNALPLPTTEEETLVDHDFDPATPLAPSGFAPFQDAYSNPNRMDSTSIRIDHTVGDKLTLFGRFSEAPSSRLDRFLSLVRGDKNEARTATLGATLSLTPRLANEFRFNYSRNRGRFNSSMDNFGGAVPIDLSALLSGHSGPGVKRGAISFLFSPAFYEIDLGDLGDSYQRQINVVDNLSLENSVHRLKFGFDYRRLAPIFGPVEYRQQANFTSQVEILSGTPSFVVIGASQGARPLFDNFSAYAQDTLKLSRRLTLDVGLRWELNPAPEDANGRRPVLVAGIRNANDVSTATLAPSDAPFYKTFYTAFAPRVGVAYQLRQASGREVVLRGGFGVYYDLGSGQDLVGFSRFPFSATSFLRNVPYPLSPAQAQPPAFPEVKLPLNRIVTALNAGLDLPYTLQWNVSLQQSLGASQSVAVSYVASAARRLLTSRLLNISAGFGRPRPNPNFGPIAYTTNGPTSDYHSFQAQYQRRLSRGLQALTSYTWSHAIDEVSSEVENGVLERGNADFDVPHNFSAAVTYDIPKLNAGSVLTSLMRDWSVDSTVYVQSGQPQKVITGNALIREDGTSVSVRPDAVPGAPFWVEDPNVPGGRRINFAAFQTPPLDPVTGRPTRQGTLGRNVVRQPAVYQVNMALRRQFNLTERWNLQFKVEAFNLFNHPLFGFYCEQLACGSDFFGVATATLNNYLGGLSSLYQIGGPRSIQLSLKLNF